MIVIATPQARLYLTPPNSSARRGSSPGARSPRLRRRRQTMMGQLGQSSANPYNAAQIVAQLCGSSPNYCTWKSGANKQGNLQAFLNEALSTLYLPDPTSSATAQGIFDASFNCATGAVNPGTSGISTAAGVTKMAATGTAAGAMIAGAAAGSVVPVVGTIVGAIAGLIGALFGGGHAAAVQGEATDICSQVPAANQVLAQIDAGLSSGQIQPSEAQTLYSQLQSQFSTALHKNTTFKTGDTLWAFTLALGGIIQARTALLNAGMLVGGGKIPTPGSAAAAVASIAGATGLPAWALPVAAFALIYALI